MKKTNSLSSCILISAMVIMNQVAMAQCICTLPNYGCPITNQGCAMGCAYYCSHPDCYSGATISASSSLTFYTGDSVILSAHRTGASTYQWMNDTVNITGAISQNYVAYVSGSYKCRVTSSCNTKTSAALIVTVLPLATGIKYLVNQYGLAVVPNPIINSATILFYLSHSQKISLKIFDVNGILISTLADKIFVAGENKLEWDMADVNAGVYVLQYQSDGNLQNKKIIVAK